MAKLKFDRTVKLSFKENEKTTVPNDEVWRGTVTGKDGIVLDASSIGTGNTVGNGVISNVLLGGAVQWELRQRLLRKTTLHKHLLQGLRLRLLNNVFAKVVSLA